jgi:hypothetical protein
MYKKIVTAIALVMLIVVGMAFADSQFNEGQDRYYTPAPSKSRTVTANTTALVSDHMIDCDTTSGAITVTLPGILSSYGGYAGGYIIRNIGTTGYSVTVAASTTDSVTNTIEGTTARVLASPMTGSYSVMQVAIRGGYDWKVLWETPPYYMNMATGISQFSKGYFMRSPLITVPTVSTVYTQADCGKIIPVSTDALTLTLPAAGAAGAGCTFEFVNVGAAGAAVINVKTASSDLFYGYVYTSGTQSMIPLYTVSTSSLLVNVKATAKIGDSATIRSIGTGSWSILRSVGVWTTS